jgi:hypothetical protein
MVTEETPGRLADLGIPEEQAQGVNAFAGTDGNAQGDVHLDDQMIAQLWGNWDS